MHSKFAGDTKLGGAVDSLKGRGALQKDHNKLEGWTKAVSVYYGEEETEGRPD